jgi:hypothetical protein
MQKSEKDKVTLSLNSKVYREFREYCDKNAIMISRKIEIWIENFLKNTKKNKNDK